MNAKELIVVLKKMPPEAPIVVEIYSGYESVGPEAKDFRDVKLETLILSHGRFERFHPAQWKEQVTNVVRCVVFPGN